MKPQIGSRVLIKDTHPGYDKGRVGTVVGYRKDGRARVRIESCVWAYVRPENLQVLQ